MAGFAQFELDSQDCLHVWSCSKRCFTFCFTFWPACHKLSHAHLLLQRSQDHALSFLVGLLHRMLAIGFISPLSQHPLYPLWSRLWTSPQNVGNRLHLIILLFKLEMSLNELQDQEHTTLTAALKSLIHPFAFSFKSLTNSWPALLKPASTHKHLPIAPHNGSSLPLVCLEPGAQQPRGLRFLNRLLHTSIFPLLHTMDQVFLLSWIGGEQRTLLVNLKHHSNSSKDKTQEYWDQSLINHQV
ncbi:hypothetical protein F2Q69_00022673 [Brassica cretica]|uniref:Uncharacterized protein n=1 Tax=Brassica cretica TaxID=69181 RepID=A0A8S9Q815_BRACR|nr:hypothetical protein F2Q69_00022673 [Brassica cretica]